MTTEKDPTRVGPTIAALLSTIAANLEAAEGTGRELGYGDVSPAEVKLLEAFTEHGLEPVQQHKIGYYRCDFFFPKERLVVEVDGKQWHHDRVDQDARRDKRLYDLGYRTLRIPAGHVFHDVDGCARAVRRILDGLRLERGG